MYTNNKRFYSLDQFLREKFAEKTIKISLNANLTCPNRDGTLSTEGCIFCSHEGSGDFTEDKNLPIEEQFNKYRARLNQKWSKAKYIAYFQAYTNTYGDISYLRDIYFRASSIKDVVGISIATRPDCLSEEVLELLGELRKKVYVFVELGFQTSNETTAKLINRMYNNCVFGEAVLKLKRLNINVVTHLIIGLPGETFLDFKNTLNYLSLFPIDGLKLQLMHVLAETKLHQMYLKKQYFPLTFEQYIDIVVSGIEMIPETIVIHRLTGDAPKGKLIAPRFSLDKRRVLNEIEKELKRRDTYQGKKFDLN